jgi:hypothetical protein
MRLLTRFTVALAIAFVGACGSDSNTAPTQSSIAGTWALVSVNGTALPVIVQATNPKVEILSEQLGITAGGTFTQTGQARLTQGTTVTTQAYADAGTYTLSGTAAVFRFNSDGSSGTGTITGNTLTVGDAGFSFVYQKQ